MVRWPVAMRFSKPVMRWVTARVQVFGGWTNGSTVMWYCACWRVVGWCN